MISIQKLEELTGTLPHISTLYVSIDEVDKMNNEQLDAFANIIPRATKVVARNENEVPVTSKNIIRLQTKAGFVAKKDAIHATYALSAFEKGPEKPSGKVSSRLPLDISKFIAEFLPTTKEIKKGLDAIDNKEGEKIKKALSDLKNNEKNNEKNTKPKTRP